MTDLDAIPTSPASAHALKGWYERNERAVALAAFVAGFLFDVFTLPRVDSWLAIGQQALYIVVILAILLQAFVEESGPPAAGVPETPQRGYRRYRSTIVHFLLGSLLNLYTIYYFKSASLLVSSSFMLVLVALLAANESKRLRALGPAFRFALLALCVLSFSAHVTPILVGTIGPRVFALSMLVGAVPLVAVALAITAWAPERHAPAKKLILAPLALVVAAFVAFYALKLIPPVPLSIPFMGIYHAVERTTDGYRLSHERQWWRLWHNGDQDFVARPGDRVYVFFRIYSPTRFSEQVQARWYWKNPARGWESQDTMRVNIVGGRAEGFRGYGWKANYRAGRWQVQVETTDGREIGRIYFRITPGAEAPRNFVTEIQ